MEKVSINGVTGIDIRGVFGLIRGKDRPLFIIVQEGDMKGIGKMIKNTGREFSSTMIEQQKSLIIDFIYFNIFY
jgi:hypothetical protein